MPTRKESFKIIERFVLTYIKWSYSTDNRRRSRLSYAVYKSYVALEKFMTLTSVDNKFDVGLEDDNLASFSFLER